MQERGLWGATPFTTLDGAQHSWEKRWHVGGGVAGLNILWNMAGVRKDKRLQRLVELCIPEGFGQLLKHKWTFRSACSECKPTPPKQRLPPYTTSIICVPTLWHIWAFGSRRRLSPWCCWLLFWAAHRLCKPLRRVLHPRLSSYLTHTTVSFSNHLLLLLWDFWL